MELLRSYLSPSPLRRPLRISPRLLAAVSCFFLVNSDAARFNDPEFCFNLFGFERFGQSPHERCQMSCGRFLWQTKNGDPCITARQKRQRVGESQIERDEHALFSSTAFDQVRVNDALKMLLPNSRNVVPGGDENLFATPTEIFIKLELQTAGSNGTST